jgi:hypothetical protein
MTLQFPNRNRFYDATRRAVRFWGHDSAMEWSFFVNEDTLRHIQSDPCVDEAGALAAFDRNVDRIHAAAMRAYGRGRKGSYDLMAADF